MLRLTDPLRRLSFRTRRLLRYECPDGVVRSIWALHEPGGVVRLISLPKPLASPPPIARVDAPFAPSSCGGESQEDGGGALPLMVVEAGPDR
jgi:hypothetical protein